MNKTGTQRLETDRLILRRFTIEDADDMYNNWASDPEVTEFRTSCGIRENMIQESTKPYRRSRFKLAWLIHS